MSFVLFESLLLPLPYFRTSLALSAAPVFANGALSDAAPLPSRVLGEDLEALNSTRDVHDNSGDEAVRNEVAADSRNEDADVAGQVDKDMVLSEELNGTPDRAVEYGNEEQRTPVDGEDDEEADEDEEEDEEEAEHPGEVSIGRKLWKFIST